MGRIFRHPSVEKSASSALKIIHKKVFRKCFRHRQVKDTLLEGTTLKVTCQIFFSATTYRDRPHCKPQCLHFVTKNYSQGRCTCVLKRQKAILY